MIKITDTARNRIAEFVDREVVRDPALRIGVAESDPRSPVARAYRISLVERDDKERTEIAVNVDGIRVLLNLDTSNLLSGATVDWVDGQNGDGGFRVEEPQREQTPSPDAEAPSEEPLELTGPIASRVQKVFDHRINPQIAAHGGAVELVDVDDTVVHLRMTGGCQGCAASAATLRMGIERMLKEAVPEIDEIVDVTDHTAGVNPYY